MFVSPKTSDGKDKLKILNTVRDNSWSKYCTATEEELILSNLLKRVRTISSPTVLRSLQKQVVEKLTLFTSSLLVIFRL